MVFKWLRDPRYAPAREVGMAELPAFPPVEIVDQPRNTVMPTIPESAARTGMIEIELAGGHRMRISDGYDPEALARLIRGLTA